MEPEKKINGALVGLIVIVVILVIGGIYVWQSNKNSEPAPAGAVTDENSAELNMLEADLETTDISTGVDVNAVN